MPVVSLHRDCPGYAEKARREEELRSIPFLGLEERIAGLPAAPLTLRKVQWLTLARSPFLLKISAEELVEHKPDLAADIILFLWIVSPQFQAGNERAKRKFYRSHRSVMRLPAGKVVAEILDYVDEAFLDAGGGSDGDERSYYSTAAAIVGFFHRHYGLSVDVWENGWARNLVRRLTGQPNVMDIPLRIAFQLIRAHQKSVNPELKLANRLSDPCVDGWLRDQNKDVRRN